MSSAYASERCSRVVDLKSRDRPHQEMFKSFERRGRRVSFARHGCSPRAHRSRSCRSLQERAHGLEERCSIAALDGETVDAIDEPVFDPADAVGNDRAAMQERFGTRQAEGLGPTAGHDDDRSLGQELREIRSGAFTAIFDSRIRALCRVNHKRAKLSFARDHDARVQT